MTKAKALLDGMWILIIMLEVVRSVIFQVCIYWRFQGKNSGLSTRMNRTSRRYRVKAIDSNEKTPKASIMDSVADARKQLDGWNI
jgi:hypothetical protein